MKMYTKENLAFLLVKPVMGPFNHKLVMKKIVSRIIYMSNYCRSQIQRLVPSQDGYPRGHHGNAHPGVNVFPRIKISEIYKNKMMCDLINAYFRINCASEVY